MSLLRTSGVVQCLIYGLRCNQTKLVGHSLPSIVVYLLIFKHFYGSLNLQGLTTETMRFILLDIKGGAIRLKELGFKEICVLVIRED